MTESIGRADHQHVWLPQTTVHMNGIARVTATVTHVYCRQSLMIIPIEPPAR